MVAGESDVGPAGHDGLITQHTPEPVEYLAQVVSSSFRIVFGPEQAYQCLTTNAFTSGEHDQDGQVPGAHLGCDVLCKVRKNSNPAEEPQLAADARSFRHLGSSRGELLRRRPVVRRQPFHHHDFTLTGTLGKPLEA